MPRGAASFGDVGSVDDTRNRLWARTVHASACAIAFPRFARAQLAMQRLESGRLAERLERLIGEAEELSGRRGITTHEAKEVFRFNGMSATAHRLHVLLVQIAEVSALEFAAADGPAPYLTRA